MLNILSRRIKVKLNLADFHFYNCAFYGDRKVKKKYQNIMYVSRNMKSTFDRCAILDEKPFHQVALIFTENLCSSILNQPCYLIILEIILQI